MAPLTQHFKQKRIIFFPIHYKHYCMDRGQSWITLWLTLNYKPTKSQESIDHPVAIAHLQVHEQKKYI